MNISEDHVIGAPSSGCGAALNEQAMIPVRFLFSDPSSTSCSDTKRRGRSRARVPAVLCSLWIGAMLWPAMTPTPALAHSAAQDVDQVPGRDLSAQAWQGSSVLRGKAFTAVDEAPLVGGVVYVEGSELTAMTDGEGRYVMGPLPSGLYRVSFYHPSLGEMGWTEPPVQLVLVPEGVELALDFVVSEGGALVEVGGPGSDTQPYQLDPIVVTARRTVYERVEREGARVDVSDRAEIASRELEAAHVGDLLRSFPSLRVSEPHPGAVCIETRRRTTDTPATALGGRTQVSDLESYRRVERSCPKMVQVYIDDVRVPLAEYLIAGLRPRDVERIEYVNGVAAGARFGTGSAEGIVLIYTRNPLSR